MHSNLFRPEVSAGKRNAWFGEIILVRPVSLRLLTTCALLSAIALLAFLCSAHYTRRVQVSGLLMPDLGLIKVQSPQAGIVLERRVREGQLVHAGDVLYVLSGELPLAGVTGKGAAPVDSDGAIIATLRARQDSVGRERAEAARLASQHRSQLAATVTGLEHEVTQLDQEIATQAERLKSAQTQYARNAQMQAQGYLSSLALQQKHDELLDQSGRLQALQHSRLALLRSLGDAQAEFVEADGKVRRELTALERQALELEEQRLSTEARRQFLITAPQAGKVTAILVDPGQMVTNQTMLTIVPSAAQLEAQLYVPSRAIGFIAGGQKVAMRFAAYPYQQFGQSEGTVVEVSRAPLTAQELPVQFGGGPNGSVEAMYRVRVALRSPPPGLRLQRQELHSGMLLDADILQDRRTLIEWVLAPVRAMKEKA